MRASRGFIGVGFHGSLPIGRAPFLWHRFPAREHPAAPFPWRRFPGAFPAPFPGADDHWRCEASMTHGMPVLARSRGGLRHRRRRLPSSSAEQLRVLTIDEGRALPSGPFESNEQSLQGQSALTDPSSFAFIWSNFTPSPTRAVGGSGRRIVSVSYLGLTQESTVSKRSVGWVGVTGAILPVEDRRKRAARRPFTRELTWTEKRRTPPLGSAGTINSNFGLENERWNEELILQR